MFQNALQSSGILSWQIPPAFTNPEYDSDLLYLDVYTDSDVAVLGVAFCDPIILEGRYSFDKSDVADIYLFLDSALFYWSGKVLPFDASRTRWRMPVYAHESREILFDANMEWHELLESPLMEIPLAPRNHLAPLGNDYMIGEIRLRQARA